MRVIESLGAVNTDAIKNAFYNAQGSAGSNLRLQTTPVMKTFEVVTPKESGFNYQPMVTTEAPLWPWLLGGLAGVGIAVYFWRKR